MPTIRRVRLGFPSQRKVNILVPVYVLGLLDGAWRCRLFGDRKGMRACARLAVEGLRYWKRIQVEQLELWEGRIE